MIYHCNVRGFESKKDSITGIINQVKPNILTLNETHMNGNKKPELYGYFSYARNRPDKSMGGVATCVSNKELGNTISMKYGEGNHEYIVTRHGKFAKPISIINIYGEQEGRTGNDEVEDKWSVIIKELEVIEKRGESAIIIGDLNKHVGNIIPGNNLKCSPGGKMVRNLINTGKYTLVNATSKAQGGPFTRYEPSNPNDDCRKSALDLIIISNDLVKYVEVMKIDKSLSLTPARVISKSKVVYSDHYAIILKFNDLPLKSQLNLPVYKYTRWNTNKVGGWETYKELTNNNAKLEEVTQEGIDNATEAMKKISKAIDKSKFQAFGKVKVKDTPLYKKEIDALYTKKTKLLLEKDFDEKDVKVKEVDKEIAEQLLSEQRKNLENELSKLKEIKAQKGRAASVFHLKERIVGSKKSQQEPAVIRDPDTKEYVTDAKEIKRISLKYCVDLLTNREPKDGYEEIVEMKRRVHKERMAEIIEDEFDFTRKFFDDCLEAVKKKNNKKYDFILKSGSSLQEALFHLFKYVWNTEEKPEQWRRTTIIQLHKKNSKDNLENYRNIHTKVDVPKLFGFMVTRQAKIPIIQNMSSYQIGTKPGHRSEEHLFVVKMVISLYSTHKKPIILQLYDIKKFFDREVLVDGMDALYSSGVRGKLYRLLFMLNKNTIVKVNTGVGTTEEAETGENIGQGTGEGAIISAANISDGITKAFKHSSQEISYGEEMLQPLLFQDDIARVCDTVEAAQHGNALVNHVMESKLLDFNLDKSVYIIVGNHSVRKSLEKEFEETPLTLAGVPMKEVTQEKYLGDQIHQLGNSESVLATIKARAGQVSAAIVEIRSIIEDCRADSVGGIIAGLDIWEASVIPFLLNNSSVWGEIPQKALDMLEDLQIKFLRCLLATPRSTPTPALLWETGSLTMLSRIDTRKLMFYHHVMSLDTCTVARKVADIAVRAGHPGLMREYTKLCAQYNLPSALNTPKGVWKRLVKTAISEGSKTKLLEQIQNKYKKLNYDALKHEKFEIKEYLKELRLSDARMKFRIRSKMVETIAFNFSNDPININRLWQCTHCDKIDSQSHVLICDSYKHLRKDKNLGSDRDLVAYFRDVISLRDKIDEEFL